jgi:hypothetical protein
MRLRGKSIAVPESDIRLEVPVRAGSGAIHLDLLACSRFGQIAIEPKYETRSLTVGLDGEDFSLMSHGGFGAARLPPDPIVIGFDSS